MAQLFKPNANYYARICIILGAIAPLALMFFLSRLTRSSYGTKVGVPYEQPVPFSHEHHVNELGLDCRYCHTSVEKSAQAGYPATHTCMSCHSQVWNNSPLLEPVRESYVKNVPIKWKRLHKVPDFAYFNHSIHIKRGLNCNTCHGPIQAEQIAAKGRAFQMRWCLECHRNPEKFVRPQGEVFTLYQKFQSGEPLTAEEKALQKGVDYQRTPAELEEGRKLVQEYHIKREQLADCAICHR